MDELTAKRRQAPTGEWQYQGDDGYWYDEAPAAPRQKALWEMDPDLYASNEVPPPPGPQSSTLPVGAWFAMLAGILMVVGAFLPWESVQIFSGGGVSRNGFQLGKDLSFSPDGVVCYVIRERKSEQTTLRVAA